MRSDGTGSFEEMRENRRVLALATGLTWDEAQAFINQYIGKERKRLNENDTLYLP